MSWCWRQWKNEKNYQSEESKEAKINEFYIYQKVNNVFYPVIEDRYLNYSKDKTFNDKPSDYDKWPNNVGRLLDNNYNMVPIYVDGANYVETHDIHMSQNIEYYNNLRKDYEYIISTDPEVISARKKRDLYLCAVCMTGKYHTINTFNYDKLSVHHIIPLAEDYNKRLDERNLITLCSYHHKMAEDGEIPRDELLELVENKYGDRK